MRNNIGSKTKQIWLILETAIEKAIQLQKQKQRERKEKNKVGRPKKNSNTNEKNMKDKNAAAFMENFLKKHDESKMDLDPQ